MVFKHAAERVNDRIGHPEPPITTIDHSLPTPVFGMFQFLEHGSIERLPDAEHAAFSGTDDGTKADDELLISSRKPGRMF